MRRLTLGSRKYVPFLAVAGLLVATAAAVGISNLTAGHSGRLGATAARADSGDGGDSDGGPQGPWVSYYAKESSGSAITDSAVEPRGAPGSRDPDPGYGAPWQSIGPVNVGGRITDLVVDPAHATTIYVAAAGGGVWKSTDEGSTFTSVWPSDQHPDDRCARDGVGRDALGRHRRGEPGGRRHDVLRKRRVQVDRRRRHLDERRPHG